MDTRLFSFAVIADVQHADVDDAYNYSKTRRRRYRNAINLLASAIRDWNEMSPQPSFLIQLGDLIDGRCNRHKGMSQACWDTALRELSAFNGKVYHTFGNHEFYNFTHKQIAEFLPSMTLGACETPGSKRNEDAQSRLRYSFQPHEDFLLVVLDAYEISMLGYERTDDEYIEAKEILTAKNKNSVTFKNMSRFMHDLLRGEY